MSPGEDDELVEHRVGTDEVARPRGPDELPIALDTRTQAAWDRASQRISAGQRPTGISGVRQRRGLGIDDGQHFAADFASNHKLVALNGNYPIFFVEDRHSPCPIKLDARNHAEMLCQARLNPPRHHSQVFAVDRRDKSRVSSSSR